MTNVIDRTGEVSYNSFGSLMVITNYRNCDDMDVCFSKYNWTKKHAQYGHFKRGNILCPYERRFYNKGYVGEGIYKIKINGKPTKHYKIWQAMLKRTYDPKYIQEHPTYMGCEVHSSWHNFQTFSEWVDENYYSIGEEQICLDKDILCKGNKIYSPNTCVFVPQRINKLFTKSDKARGDSPIGVSYDKLKKKYVACCQMNGKQKTLGYYNKPEEAFQVYKNFKENYIKEVAEEYKNVIPTKLYNAMINYQIEIDD